MRPARHSAMVAAGLILGIEADPAARWSLRCSLTEGGLTRELRQDGSGSLQLPLAADRADCTAILLTGAGMSLTVRDERGNRSRSSLSGAGSKARLRVG